MKIPTWLRTLLLVSLSGLVAPASWGQLTLVKDINYGGSWSYPDKLVNVNGTLYFRANNGIHGVELWKSDGTATGTVLVKDIHPGDGWSSPEHLVNVNGTLYFSADDGTNGREVWKSDGTANGTVMVKNIHPYNASNPEDLTNINGTLFFEANDGGSGVTQLWKSDGTENGTVKVKPFGQENGSLSELTNVNGTLLFVGDDDNFDAELWRSDGTEAGTYRVKDIDDNASSAPHDLTAVGNTLFFVAADGTHGEELWKSDGTEVGTALVKDIHPTGSSTPASLFSYVGYLFFTADDGTHGRELWRSDGLEWDTVLLKDIALDQYVGSSPSNIMGIGNTLYFQADDGRGNGVELWKSNTDGTVLVKDIHPGGSSSPQNLVDVNDVLYFTADDGTHGEEVWKSDGTAAGTVLVMDLSPGEGGSILQQLTAVGKVLFFAARSGAENSPGLELYRTAAPPPCDTRLAGAPTVLSARLCQGDGLSLTFATVNGCPDAPEETFRVELSNAVGSFAKPTNLGFAAPVGSVIALPPGLVPGTGYRIRVVSGGRVSAASLPFRVEVPSLSVTPTVTEVPVCRGNQVAVSFNLPTGSCPFFYGNGFTAQLSSATGSFNSPINLGPVTPGQPNFLTIPANVAAGGYRIRVVSSSPSLTSSNSALFQVKVCPTRLSAEEAQLVVAPNPVMGGNAFPGEIRCRVSGMDNPQFSLTTATGRNLSLTTKTDGSGEFVLTPQRALTAGVYVLQASEGTTRLTRRVLVIE